MHGIRSLSHGSLRVQETRARQTPPPAGRQFRDAMAHTAARVLGGLESAAPLVPGGALVGLAARRASGGVGAAASALQSGGSSGAPGPLGETAGSGGLAGSSETLELLALQRDIGLEQQRYSVLSNVLKARHETARSVIQNVR